MKWALGSGMLKRFLKSDSGNFAMMAAIGLPVMLVAVGAAVDFSSATKKQQSLQDMVDNATLAAAQIKDGRRDDMQALVDKVIAQHNTQNWPIKAKVRLKNDVVYVDVSTEYKTILMGIVGKDKIDIKADAGAPLAKSTPINLALVLDTTDSMYGDNIRDLKIAAKEMVDVMSESESTVRMSVVPFGKYVNVGMKNKNASWIDTSKDGTYKEYEYCYNERRTVKKRVCCGTGRYRTQDIIVDGQFRGTRRIEEQECTPGIYVPTGRRICEMRQTHYNWYGCAGSRQSPYNERAPHASRDIPGIMNERCGTEMLPLVKNLKKVSRTIDDLEVKGETYLPSGVIWGWRSLQKDTPLTEVRKSYKNKRSNDPINAMVVMTDGENTLSQNNGQITHNGRDSKAANARTSKLCESAKKDGIQIYTVGYRMGGGGRGEMEKLLKSCASEKDNYFDARNAEELKRAFNDIAERLNLTRLTI